MNSTLFESFLDSAAGRRATSLMVKHKRPLKDIFVEVRREATFAFPFLIDGSKYTTKQLSNPDSWADWFTAEHRVAGICLAFFVREGVIGLLPHLTRSGKGTKKYFRPSSNAVAAKSSIRRTPVFTIFGPMP